jgi:hypothetical protein
VWLLLQSSIIISVSWVGIYHEWTPNKYALGVVAVGAAWLATWLISKAIDLRRRLIRR